MQGNEPTSGMRGVYQRKMLEVRGAFEAGGASGAVTIAARAAALDELVKRLWAQAMEQDPRLRTGIALVAVGGYGRRELFPYSDVDLLFLLDGKVAEKDVKDAIRRVNQEMWDCGIRVAPATRKLAECEKFDPDNAEFALSLLDHRLVTGDETLYGSLAGAKCAEAVAAGAQGGDGSAAGDDACSSCEVWRHVVSPGAEYQGLSRRLAGCACVRVDDQAARSRGVGTKEER